MERGYGDLLGQNREKLMPLVNLKRSGVVPVKTGLRTTTATCLLDEFEDKQDRITAVGFGYNDHSKGVSRIMDGQYTYRGFGCRNATKVESGRGASTSMSINLKDGVFLCRKRLEFPSGPIE